MGCSAPGARLPFFLHSSTHRRCGRGRQGRRGPLPSWGRGLGSLGPAGRPYGPCTGWMRASSRGGSSAKRMQGSHVGPWGDSPLLMKVSVEEVAAWGVAVPHGTVARYQPGEVDTRSRSRLTPPPHVTNVPLLRSIIQYKLVIMHYRSISDCALHSPYSHGCQSSRLNAGTFRNSGTGATGLCLK